MFLVLTEPASDFGYLESIVNIARACKFDHLGRKVHTRHASCQRLQPQPRESRSATEFEHRQVLPVSHYRFDQIVKTLRRLVIQLFANIEFVERRESLVKLLDTF